MQLFEQYARVACPLCRRNLTRGSVFQIQQHAEEEGQGGPATTSTITAAAAAPPGVVFSKARALLNLMNELRNEDATAKILVFTQYMESIELLKELLPSLGYKYRTLTGNMSRSQRSNALRDFQNDPHTTVFLLSARSGACGINLTQANHVVLYDPMINRNLEKQAISRAWRLGQTRPVRVHRLLVRNSVETRIMELRAERALQLQEGTAGAIKEDRKIIAIADIQRILTAY